MYIGIKGVLEMKKIWTMIFISLLMIVFVGCSNIKVEQKISDLEAGYRYNLKDLFSTDDNAVTFSSEQSSYEFNKLGEQHISVVATKEGKDQEFEFTFNVVDTKAPTISLVKSSLEFEEKYDPLKLIKVKDNYSNTDKIKVEVLSDEINVKKGGNYEIEYRAVDENGNETVDSFIVTVEDEPLKIGDTIKTANYNFTLKGVEFSYDVIPTTSNIVYHHYPADPGQIYVYIKANIKNTSEYTLTCNEIYNVTVIYDGKYEYEGFNIIRKGDGDFDNAWMWENIEPLSTMGIDALVDCPKEVKTKTKKSVKIKISFGNGKSATYVIR